MRAPISFVYGNCIVGAQPDDVWAAFSVCTHSYEWLSQEAKQAHLSRWIGALEALQADVQILRVARSPDPGVYASGAEGRLAAAHRVVGRDYVRQQAARLGDLSGTEARTFLLASLREPQRDVASYVSRVAESHPREWLRAVSQALSRRDGRLLSAAWLERMRIGAERVHAVLRDFLPVGPASGVELQWLVRRAYCRGLGEPLVDGLHEPRALAFECNGRAVLAPLEGDVIRWMDGCVERRGRALRVESELGEAWQALLVLGALPECVQFPGAGAELMFAPVESLPFGVDISLNTRFLPNELAVRIARRRVQDADQIARAESDGEQGISDLGYRRTQQSRDLLSYLQASRRPALLRCTFSLALAAANEQQLDERVQMCRRAYGQICLHRPLGEQLGLFVGHLPGQRTRVAGYDDMLTTEQLAAMMPAATHLVGSRKGFYLGHTLSGSRRPVLFNLREGSERDRNTAILSVGALGSGKTTLAQKLQYEGFLQGARVIDCDPKGDHRFHRLEQVAPHAHTIDLRADAALRGMLDPLRVGPAHMRHELAVSFLCDLLPERADPAWETAIVAAVDAVARRAANPTCLEVVRSLLQGGAAARQVGQALEVYARSGLTQLGFADARRLPPGVGDCQVTYIAIRDLPGARAGTPRAEYTREERVGTQIVRLLAMFAMDLMSRERERLKLFCFDEGWRLLEDPVGRTLLGSLQRMGRSELAVPIISTQLVTDALIGERQSLESLLGATFVFGMRSHVEAARALALLGLDTQDDRARELLLELQAGRCLLRDHTGRIEAIQVELAPWLAGALSTTPPRLDRHATVGGG